MRNIIMLTILTMILFGISSYQPDSLVTDKQTVTPFGQKDGFL